MLKTSSEVNLLYNEGTLRKLALVSKGSPSKGFLPFLVKAKLAKTHRTFCKLLFMSPWAGGDTCISALGHHMA